MLTTILVIAGAGAVLSMCERRKKDDDTVVTRGKTAILGRSYKEVKGKCFRCDGTGFHHGQICRKCHGTGRYERTTWHETSIW